MSGLFLPEPQDQDQHYHHHFADAFLNPLTDPDAPHHRHFDPSLLQHHPLAPQLPAPSTISAAQHALGDLHPTLDNLPSDDEDGLYDTASLNLIPDDDDHSEHSSPTHHPYS